MKPVRIGSIRNTRSVLKLWIGWLLLTILIASPSTAQEIHENVKLPKNISDCQACHTCEEPTPHHPCLQECPRPYKVEGTPVPAEESPETVILDELEELYVPVVFAHKLHAEMSEIGNGCTMCHHYTPTDKSHPPCKECHQPGPAERNLRQPGLKGAYHRQCMGCHREWSHETECAVCHVKKAGGPLAPSVGDQADIVGVPHPILHEPETEVYKTAYAKGPIVTFHHEEHIQLFDLKCVDCHKKESCSDCHELGKIKPTEKTFKEHHQPCYSCHEGAQCSHCHDTKVKPLFTHEQVGWPHNRFHKDLKCRSCHPTGQKISKLDTECTSCHMNWYPGGFKHQVTGAWLGDLHIELDCGECHIDQKFDVKPTCENCHDEAMKYTGEPIP